MKYKIIDNQGMGTFGDKIFNDKEEIRQQLISFHSVDYTGETPIEEKTLEDILDYGNWSIFSIEEKISNIKFYYPTRNAEKIAGYYLRQWKMKKATDLEMQ